MALALSLGAALKRGAWIVVANWPVILIDFSIESLFKVALTVPVIGGAFVVAVLLGTDVQQIVSQGVAGAADLVMRSLSGTPLTLAAFLAAVGIVGLGGAMLMYVVKAGTLGILVAADRTSGEFHRQPLSRTLLRRASAYSLGTFAENIRHYRRRMITLTMWLGAGYFLLGSLFLLTLMLPSALSGSRWAAAWPIVMLISTSAGVVALTILNVIFDLVRIVVVTDDCGTGEAGRRLRTFVIQDARHVLGIFGVMTAILAITTAASLSAVASVTLVAWVPVAGLIVVPLQIIAWIVRGLLLQCVGLSALAAYQTQYRRFSENHFFLNAESVRTSPRSTVTANSIVPSDPAAKASSE